MRVARPSTFSSRLSGLSDRVNVHASFNEEKRFNFFLPSSQIDNLFIEKKVFGICSLELHGKIIMVRCSIFIVIIAIML